MLGWLFSSCRSCRKNKTINHQLSSEDEREIRDLFDLVNTIYISAVNKFNNDLNDKFYKLKSDISRLNSYKVGYLRKRDKYGWTLFHRIVQAELRLSDFNPRGARRLDRDNLIQACLRLDSSLVDIKTLGRVEITALDLASKKNNQNACDILLAFGAKSLEDYSPDKSSTFSLKQA